MLHKIKGIKIHRFKGYEMVYYPKHPNSWKSGMIFLHRIIIENKIGRLLNLDEIVHHRDGNKSNNKISNLKIHKSVKEHCIDHKKLTEKECLKCNEPFMPKKSNQLYCSVDCGVFARRKVERPEKEALLKLVWLMPSSTIALKYGVSGKAIQKWCLKYGIKKPPRGYWAKQKPM